MKTIDTIDLWTEQHPNHYDCFNGAFSDGFESERLPYDSYKLIKNCNCLIENNKNIPIGNKHQAIVFYLKNIPVRLLVADLNTNLEKCVNNALNQQLGKATVKEILNNRNITFSKVDLNEQPKLNAYNGKSEVDIGSCDRLSLLKSMLGGSYTDDQSTYGHFDSTKYFFDKNVSVEYKLKTDNENFDIQHECAFFNDLQTRAIIIQKKMWSK